MRFNLESGKSKEINETPEVKVDSEQLSETEETAENFDDCSLNEVQDSKGNEVNAESLEDAEEDYDDCEAKIEEMEEKNPELDEEDDDFNDCGKETEGQYVAEVTYTTDGEISHEEAGAEVQEAYNECDDPEDMQQLKENANENEHIEVHNAEVVERPENSEMGEEVTEEQYEEAQQELDEAQENFEAQQEAAQEYQEDLENQINKHENEVPERTENINDEASENSEETENSNEVEETTEKTEGSDEVGEVTEKTEDSETEEIGTEDLENMEDGSKVETSEIDEENLSENVSQEVEKETDTELSDETKEQISEEVSDEIAFEAENNEISAAETEETIEEKKAEAVDSLNEQSEAMDEEIEQKANEVAEQDDLTEEEAKEQISEEVSENTSENLSDDEVDAMVEEKSETIEETIEKKAEEQETVDSVEETADEFEDEKAEQLSEQSEQSLQERIDGAFEKEDVTASEINSLRDEHSAELQEKIEEKSTTEAELKSKFDEVLSKEKGADEYRQSLQEYNALQDKKSELDEQIATMEKQQDLLDKKSIELRDAQIQKGSEAMVASAATLARVNMLQDRYDQTHYATKVDKTELANIRDENCFAIKELSAEKDSIKQAMDAKMDEISEYVISNNMNRYDTVNDLHYQQMSAEYNAMKENYDKIGYSIVKLDENNKAITEQLGDKYTSMLDMQSVVLLNNNFPDLVNIEHNYSLESKEFISIMNELKEANVDYLSIELANKKRTSNEIIERLSGGDLTEGSCSSLAFAYVGNKAGYDVLDFRDGESRVFFSSRNSIRKIANLPNINSEIICGKNDIQCVNKLFETMKAGKEYYLATGQHASIVRCNNDTFEYLELQHPSTDNGWHNLDNNILLSRFCCSTTHSLEFSNFLIDVESLSNSQEFLHILGYINTSELKQRKGELGNVR